MKRWSWKQMSVRLLIAPVVAACPILGLAFGQQYTPTVPRPGDSGQKMQLISPIGKPNNADPKELLRLGRKALADGRVDEAQELARMAEASNPNGRWGLFGDTPEALVKDCVAVRARTGRTESPSVIREVRELLARPARNDQERAAYLQQALLKIKTVPGSNEPAPRSGAPDHPAVLKQQIELALGTVKHAVPDYRQIAANQSKATSGFYGAGSVNLGNGGTETAVRPTVGTDPTVPQPAIPAVAKTDPAREKAVALMVEGRSLMARQELVSAQAKFLEAQKLNAPFSTTEDNPDRCLQDCMVSGDILISNLIEKGHDLVDRKKNSEAMAAFGQAKEVANGLGLRSREVDRAIAQLKSTEKTAITRVDNVEKPIVIEPGTAPVIPPPTGKAPSTSMVITVPTVPNPEFQPTEIPSLVSPPVQPPRFVDNTPVVKPVAPVVKPVVPVVQPELASDEGRQLLDKAEVALKNGTVDFARKLAIQAANGNYGVQSEAQAMLRSIDVASNRLKKQAAEDELKAAIESFNHKQYDQASKILNQIDFTRLSEESKNKLVSMQGQCEKAIAKLNEVPEVKPDPKPVVAKVDPVVPEVKPAPQPPVVAKVDPVVPEVKEIPLLPDVKPDPIVVKVDPVVPEVKPLPGVAKIDTTVPEVKPVPMVPEIKPYPVPEVAKVDPVVKPEVKPLPKIDEPKLIPSTPIEQPRTALSEPKTSPTPAIPVPVDPKTASPGSLADQVKSLANIEFQQLRDESLRVEEGAIKAFNKGETDQALNLLADFITKVRSSKLSSGQQNMLLAKIEQKNDTFRLMKHQMDVIGKETKDKKEFRDKALAKNAAEQQKNEEIQRRVQQVHALTKQGSAKEAEKLALQTKMLNPDDPTLNVLYELAKRNNRVAEQKSIKDEKENQFYKNVLAVRPGPDVDLDNPVAMQLERARISMTRGSADEMFVKNRTPIEREIEHKLDKPLTLTFENATLREAINKFSQHALLNIVFDDAALEDEKIDIERVIINQVISQPISLRNVMQLVLEKARLQYVVENDVIRVTTTKKAKGRMYTKVFSVMDLVTPIPDFVQPEHASLTRSMQKAGNTTPAWSNAGPSPSGKGMDGGQLVGGPGSSSPFAPPGGYQGSGGVLDSTVPGTNTHNPLSGSANVAPNKSNYSEQLKKLVTSMVRPYAWEDLGGSGKIAYYDIGGALVVNQTADIIREVQDLLESLRRLQDLSVAVEVRVISLSESFYERIGVDFNMNIKTNHNSQFEQALTTGQFRPEPFLNNMNVNNQTVGWNPATSFTSDLNVPIRPNSYGFSVPPFGGYPGNGQGGLNIGLAFLNDIQVFMFLEAAAGDRRVNVMQAPKLTMFNGQTATVFISDFTFFTTGLQVVNVGGQFVYIPQNTPFPIGNASQQILPGGGGGGGGQNNPGVNLTIQPVVSADRRFVRITLPIQLSAISSANVPLFPVTAFITPVFEGGSQGVPIPFTQFFQQPSFSQISVQSTVVVPDGGTVLVGGLKTLEEGRNEFGPPVISQLPYLNRLFKNVGIGRETRHIMIMVSARIIIASEEEMIQTSSPGSGGQ